MPYDVYEIDVEVRMTKRYKVRALSLNRAKEILEARLDSGKSNPYCEDDDGKVVYQSWDYD